MNRAVITVNHLNRKDYSPVPEQSPSLTLFVGEPPTGERWI